MFVELMPLLADRTVMISVARENAETIRVNVIPKRISDDENAALSTPLSYIGTPEEIDRELGKHLAGYVECHRQLGSNLAQAKAEMEAAAKAAREEADKKSAERKKKADEKQREKAEEKPAAPPVAAKTVSADTINLFAGQQASAPAGNS